MKKKNILVFGSNGMLGVYVTKFLSKEGYNVKALTRKDFNICADTFCDLQRLMSVHAEDSVIINCAGAIPHRKPSDLEYIKINSEFPHLLQKWVEERPERNCQLIHISTDCVYSGNKGEPHNERDAHTSETTYGKSKSLGEPSGACIIRTSIIGEEINNKFGLLEWAKSQKGKEINGYVNHLWNGVTCLQLAKCIKYIIEDNLYWEGACHIYTPIERTDKRALLKAISEVFDLNLSIKPQVAPSLIDRRLESDFNLGVSVSILQQLIETKNFNIYE